MTIAFLQDQPAEYHAAIMDLLASGSVQMSLLLEMDFASGPVFICSRAVPFEDLKWGHEWRAGGGLLVGLPEIGGGDGSLAPKRSFRLGIPHEWITVDTWRADTMAMIRDRGQYTGRRIALYGQLFAWGHNGGSVPVGYPFAFHVGFMDRITVSFLRAGPVLTLSAEGFLARKGVPVYGMQTYFDQKRRFPDDEGFEYVTEADRLIAWTNW